MSLAEYAKKLKDLPFHEITIGYTTIHLFAEAELSEGQIGYSIDSNGNSLVGEKDGDWKKNWLVIGYEELCGDPLFIDLDSENFPVFTAIHGAGIWQGTLIAGSFEGFIKSLELAAKSISSKETLKEIRSLNPQANLKFWGLLFEED